jgi:hypothetical protein
MDIIRRVSRLVGVVAVGGLAVMITRALWKIALPMALLVIAVNFATYALNVPGIEPMMQFYGAMAIAGIFALFFILLYMGRE